MIRIHGDGKCLFRSVAVASSVELRTARRTVFSCPTDKKLIMLEEGLADQLQQDVLSVLRSNIAALKEVTCNMGFLLDNKVGESFPTVEDRIESVETTGYAGYLEILVLAYILNTQFRIYTRQQPTDKSYTLFCNLPPDSGVKYSDSICLLYLRDTTSHAGHYDLMVPKWKITQPTAIKERVRTRDKPFMQFLNLTLSSLTSDSITTGTSDVNRLPPQEESKQASDEEISGMKIDDYGSDQTDDSVTNSSELQTDKAPYPAIWSAKQAEDFSVHNPWLKFSNGCLGCKICQQITNYGAFKKNGLKISAPWSTCSVTYNGKHRQSQLSSLRKKIHEHANGQQHTLAEEIVQKASANVMETVVAEQQKHLYDSTTRVFRSVYSLMKNNRPFTDLPSLINLQAKNGLDMGIILHSETTAADISGLIGSEMRAKLCAEVISSGSKIALIMDESTTIASKSVLILYIRAAVRNTVTSFFLDLVEMNGCGADDIVRAVMKTLLLHGFKDEYLASHLIAVCSDGASVMVGHNSGVLKTLEDKFPGIIRWHCLCHRIELSVGDTLVEVSGVNHFKHFMDKLYSVYSQSPKNQRELAACAAALDIQLQKVGKIFTVRWVASSYRAVLAVHRNYNALYNHFKSAAGDARRDNTQRQQYRGLADALASEAFVLNLGLMIDALQELNNISQELQRDDITLSRAYQVMNRTIRALEKMKEEHPLHITESVDGVAEQKYRNVHIISHRIGSRKQVAIERNQFLQSLADNLRSRLYTVIASNVSAENTAQSSRNKSEFEELISQVTTKLTYN